MSEDHYLTVGDKIAIGAIYRAAKHRYEEDELLEKRAELDHLIAETDRIRAERKKEENR